MNDTLNLWLTIIVAAVLLALLALAFPQRRHIVALARLTFLEAIRKKVLVVFLLFALILIGVAQFFPVFKPEDRLRVVETICFWAMSTFGMIVAIFVAAVSLPNDLSEKTIYTVSTKPVRRGTIILGKVLGFAGVSAVIMALMGAASLITFHYVDARVRQETHGSSGLFARWSIPASESYFVGPGVVERDGRPVVTGEAHSAFIWFFPHPALLVKLKPEEPLVVGIEARFAPQPGFTGSALPLSIETKSGEKWAKSMPVDVKPGDVWKGVLRLPPSELDPAVRSSVLQIAVGPRTPFQFQAGKDDLSLWLGDMRIRAEKVAPSADGLSPKRTVTWIAEKGTHKAVWIFRHLKRSSLPPETIEGFADEFRISSNRMGINSIDLRLTIEDPKDPKRILDQETVTSTRERPTLFRFPAKCISPDGTLCVAFERTDPASYLGVPDHLDFGIYARHASFDWNFTKALLVIYFQLVLLSAVAVAGSTFLSAPVSVIFAFFIFFCGNLVDFMRNAATILSWNAPVASKTPAAPLAFWPWVWDGINRLIEFTLPRAAKIIPALQQFDLSDRVISGDAIPWSLLVNAFVYFAAFGLFAVVVGQIVFRTKEIE